MMQSKKLSLRITLFIVMWQSHDATVIASITKQSVYPEFLPIAIGTPS